MNPDIDGWTEWKVPTAWTSTISTWGTHGETWPIYSWVGDLRPRLIRSSP